MPYFKIHSCHSLYKGSFSSACLTENRYRRLVFWQGFELWAAKELRDLKSYSGKARLKDAAWLNQRGMVWEKEEQEHHCWVLFL
jgi:hypothetical protein